MKRIIFSIYGDNVNNVGESVTDYKSNNFRAYKDQLVKCKQVYANKCKADFVLIDTSLNNFVDIQFEKIRLLEEFARSYDEVLYLDFDVIPNYSARSIFDSVDTSKLSMHPLNRPLNGIYLRGALLSDWLDSQSMYVKTCSKRSMLLLEGINGNNLTYNTGVVLGNSEIIKQVNFIEQLDDMHELLEEACEDNLYPPEISRHFVPNNEVYISYLIEKNNIPHHDLSMNWNFILDDVKEYATASAELIHAVNKNFDMFKMLLDYNA